MEFKYTTKMLEDLMFTPLIKRYVGNMKYEQCSVYDKLSGDFLLVDRDHALEVIRDEAERQIKHYKRYSQNDQSFLNAMCELWFEVSEENLNYLYERLAFELTLD